MLHPENPLSPVRANFLEAWHAQTLALADSLIRKRYFTAEDWAQTLGSELKAADSSDMPDTEEAYYLCALAALERLSNDEAGISSIDLARRKSAWESAYRETPHGQPVKIPDL